MLLVHTVVPLLLIEAAKCLVILSVQRMDGLPKFETTAEGKRQSKSVEGPCKSWLKSRLCEMTWDQLDWALWRFWHTTSPYVNFTCSVWLNSATRRAFDLNLFPRLIALCETHHSGGKFGRGRTLMKWERNCLEVSCTGTEVSYGPKGEHVAWSVSSVRH